MASGRARPARRTEQDRIPAFLFVELHHRRVDNNQGLTEVAGIVGVPEPADGRVRRLVKLDRLLLT
jgi:hypothetical protein